METTLDSIRDIKVYQRKDGYRFSLDAVLLSSFAEVKRAGRIADLGAGSGVVGLLLAKKYKDASVTLIELQEGLYRLARKNIGLNGLEDRVEAVRCDIREMPAELSGAFDMAVSNPPFRKPKTGLLSEGEERAIARHELKVDLRALLRSAATILRHGGRLFLVYHPLRLAELFGEMRAAGLEPKRARFVHGRPKAEARMALFEAAKGGRPGLKVEPPLVVRDEAGGYTRELLEIFG